MTSPVIPKPAASIMVIRDTSKGLEILMMKRAETLAFAPGAFVFPGGKVDEEDLAIDKWRALVSDADFDDIGFRIAAIRELHEEVGVFYTAQPPKTAPSYTEGDHPALRQLLRDRGEQFQTDQLVPFAQWVTPDGVPRRYDTHFFLAPLEAEVDLKADGSEAVSAEWVSPHALLDDWEEGGAPLMFPTRLNLMKLAKATTVQEALSQAKASDPVRVIPIISGEGKTRTVTIPESAGFGVTAATPKELSVEAPPRPQK